MSRTLADLENDYKLKRGVCKVISEIRKIIDERITQLEKNDHNKLTKHKNDDDIDKEIKRMIKSIVDCNSSVEAIEEIIPDLIEFGRKEELERLKRS